MMPRLTKLLLLLAVLGLVCYFYQPLFGPHPRIQFSSGNTESAKRSIPVQSAKWTASKVAHDAISSRAAVQLLDASIDLLNQSPPLIAKVQLETHLFDTVQTAAGRYMQSHAGQSRYRWDFMFDIGGQPVQASQMFDGRFYYALNVHSEQRLLEYVDLYQVPSLVNRNVGVVAQPESWFGTGGLAKLLEHFRASFIFDLAQQTKPSNRPGMSFQVLRGQWNPTSLKHLLRNQIEPKFLEPEIDWRRIPPQVPHAVEIWLGGDENLSWFPYRIILYRFVRQRDRTWRAEVMIQTTLYEVELLENIDEQNFRVDTTGVKPVELTDDYLARIRMYLTAPVK